MSGLVVAFGDTDHSELEGMLHAISHRGPDAAGICEIGHAMLAQNYLRADGVLVNGKEKIPAGSPTDARLRICYDGQMGNWEELAQSHGVSHGPFKEERLLLHLYQRHGKDMLKYLNDAVFAFVISDGEELFAARDLLGIKTLYYGSRDDTLYLGSELKTILKATEDVYEFPPGHHMDHNGRLTRFAGLPQKPPEVLHEDVDTMIFHIRSIIDRSLKSRIDFRVPTGSLLSGGIDSSIVSYLACEAYKERIGKEARLKTFAIGVNDSEDIQTARIVAQFLNSDHHEVIVGLEEILEVLPEVIYYLESFDPSLVRSAVSNFLISGYAKEHGIQVLLSGEGGDELFCGYTYLKQFPAEELFARQIECIGFLHNNASLRLDRMNHCHSLRVVAPLISGELLNYAMAIPLNYKLNPEGKKKIEKWIFRKAFESLLPERVVWRLKQEFSQGSGSAGVLPAYLEKIIADKELSEAQAEYPLIRSKEELHYFRIFSRYFGTGPAVQTVGQWVYL